MPRLRPRPRQARLRSFRQREALARRLRDSTRGRCCHYAGVAMSAVRPYQLNAIAEIEKAIEESKRRLLYVAPTGAGKTVVGAEIINRAVERHHRVLVIAHRREIITQTRDKLVASGVNPGIVLAGFEDELRPYANVQVAGIQTLHARAIRSNRMPMPAATVVIIDEAHHARART